MFLLAPHHPHRQIRFGLAARLSLTLIGATALVFITAFYYDYRESRRHMLDITQEVLADLAAAIANSLDMMRNDVQAAAVEIAQGIMEGDAGPELRHRAQDALAGSQDAQAVTVLLAAAQGQPERPVLHCYRSRLRIFCEILNEADALLAELSLSHRVLSVGPSRWSEPQVIPPQTEPATFHEAPIYRESTNGPVQVATVRTRLNLAHLATAVERLRLFQTGYVIILSQAGRYLSYPNYSDQEWHRYGTIFELARSLQSAQLHHVGEQMTQGKSGFIPFAHGYLNHDQPAHIYFAPLPGAGWSIGVVFADHALFAPLNTLTRDIILIGGVGLALLLLLVTLIVRRFIRPLLVLTEKSAAIAGGDLDVMIPESRTGDEVGVLTHSFAQMRRALRQQLEILAETRAAQARIDNELKIARTIQANFLPRDLAGLGGSSGLGLAAWFQPAMEVGGDLYNGFWLDDDRLFLCIGDVAGKGVPAALMMAVTTTLMKAVAISAPDPAEVLQRVNNELCAINEELLFVTMFAAVLVPRTGELAYSNAGHNPPLLRRVAGGAELIRIPPGLVLGIEPDSIYMTEKLQLVAGETLLLYTDGLTEAMNSSGECFGNERLLAVGNAAGDDSPAQLTQRIVAAVADHAGNAEQHDDLTLLAVARLPVADAVIQIHLAAELDRLPELLDPVRQAAEQAGLTEAQIMRLELAVEEALVNLCDHAYADRTEPGPADCRIVVDPDGLWVEIIDEGPPFDPLARPDPNTTLGLDEREPGGLGVFLIKQLVSEVSYCREGDRNVLTIRVVR